MAEQLTMAAAGDAMITRRWSEFDGTGIGALVSAIRDADASIVNLEMLFHDFEGYPAVTGSGIKFRAKPSIADELDWAGFNLYSAATNHAMDYSYGGMESTMETLTERGLAYAGLGENLSDARAPAYLNTGAGRVAMISACTTVVSGSEAGRQRSDMHGRPGISPLRLETNYVVSQDQMEQLRQISEELGMEALKRSYDEWGGVESEFQGTIEGRDTLRLLSMGVGGPSHFKFEVGSEPGIHQEPVQHDVDEILEQISVARRTADWVIISLHAHEGENGRLNDATVAPFMESFAKGCVDAGVDAFVGHGPHRLRGMEIYKQSPIFYSLGNLFAELETTTRLPAEIYEWYGLGQEARPIDILERWGFDEAGERIAFLANREFWESVVPICSFDDGGVNNIELLPVELGFERERPTRGTPELASGDVARRIIDRLKELSNSYGIEINFETDRGYVAV